MSADKRIEELGLELPPPPQAAGVYKSVIVIDRMCHLSGHLPVNSDGSLMTGRVGADLDQKGGYDAARQVGLTMLSTLKARFGTLGRVERVVKLLGMVNVTADFDQHPAVINGCSELFRDIWGEDQGVSTRSALGVASLPLGVPVEIEGTFLLRKT